MSAVCCKKKSLSLNCTHRPPLSTWSALRPLRPTPARRRPTPPIIPPRMLFPHQRTMHQCTLDSLETSISSGCVCGTVQAREERRLHGPPVTLGRLGIGGAGLARRWAHGGGPRRSLSFKPGQTRGSGSRFQLRPNRDASINIYGPALNKQQPPSTTYTVLQGVCRMNNCRLNGTSFRWLTTQRLTWEQTDTQTQQADVKPVSKTLRPTHG